MAELDKVYYYFVPVEFFEVLLETVDPDLLGQNFSRYESPQGELLGYICKVEDLDPEEIQAIITPFGAGSIEEVIPDVIFFNLSQQPSVLPPF